MNILRVPSVWRILIVAALASAPAYAQTPQWGVAATYPIPGVQSPLAMDVADLNLDGRLDVLVIPAATASPAAVLLGQPGGTLTVQYLPAETGLYGQALSIGLLDGDNIPDALAFYLMHGYGDGTFTQSQNPPLASIGLIATDRGDLNGDGRIDIAGTDGSSLRIWFGTSQGGFTVPLSYSAGCGVVYLDAADADGDGDQDVLGSCPGGLLILTNQQAAGFTLQTYGRGAASRPVVGDFTSDGVPDIFIDRRLLTGIGSGLFVPGPQYTSLDNGWYEGFDADGDGQLDVAAHETNDRIVIARSRGDGTFDVGCIVQTTSGGGVSIRAANMLGNARAELVVLGNSAVSILRSLAPDCDGNLVDDPVQVVLDPPSDCNSNGIPDFCEGDCDANGVLDPCQIAGDPTQDLDADGTLDICETAGTPFCFGDGTASPCPCDPGQAGQLGAGCQHSGGAGGRLEARGNPFVSLDSITLRATSMLPNPLGLFFQGNQQQAGGLGSAYGDGLLCVNQNVVRLGNRMGSNHTVSFGYSVPGDPRVSVAGQVPAVGGTRYYQFWYRDSAAFCTPGTFNMTNAVQINWGI